MSRIILRNWSNENTYSMHFQLTSQEAIMTGGGELLPNEARTYDLGHYDAEQWDTIMVAIVTTDSDPVGGCTCARGEDDWAVLPDYDRPSFHIEDEIDGPDYVFTLESTIDNNDLKQKVKCKKIAGILSSRK